MVFNEDLKYRMYILVERHLSPLDKGIQSAHAVAEYYNECRLWNKKEEMKAFDKWDSHLLNKKYSFISKNIQK